jgi:hypothetical protein
MRIKRLIIGGLLAAAIPAAAPAQTAKPSLAERIAAAAADHRQRLDFVDGSFSGDAWERLLAEGRAAQFFLLGEEHGVAENARLAAALFEALAPSGYSRFVIEVSPPMASALDRSARDGLDGLVRQFAQPGGEPAFFGMKEEAELLAAARASVGGRSAVFWGVDYEVGGDRLLIARLAAKKKPKAAAAALAALRNASDESWAQYQATHNPQFIFSFAGDPALVRALRQAWPRRDAESEEILSTLEETFEINRHWIRGEGWASNERRARLMRRNFLAHWRREGGADRRVFAKLGASHLVRGLSQTEVYDLGSLIPEIAALGGGSAFHLLVLPGVGAPTAVFDPTKWAYAPAPPKDGYMAELEPILAAAFPDSFTLVDLRPLRPLLGGRSAADPELKRIVHGFDMALILTGSTPSRDLSEE